MEYRAIVQAVLDSHPEFATNPDRDDAKSKVLPFVVNALNTADAATGWGVLVKTDQGDKIPGDIVVWRSTMQHFDVMTDTEAIWDEKGVVTNPAWVWRAPGPTKQPPVDVPQPPTQPQPEVTLEQFVNAVVVPIVSSIRVEADRLYTQNERIFADLTAQNRELKSILLQTGGKDFTSNTPSTLQAALGAVDPTKTVHISQQSIERIITVGAPLLARLLGK